MKVFFFLFLSLFVSCVRQPIKSREQALRKVSTPSSISDDLSTESLIEILKANAERLRTLNKSGNGKLVFGERVIPIEEYAAALTLLVEALQVSRDKGMEFIQSQFEFYEVYGGGSWGEILLTSYFEPEIEGSKIRQGRFTTALLARPNDLVEVALSQFDDRFFNVGTMRGRLKKKDGKVVLYPYFSRQEIDSGQALMGQKLEFCWVDPIDAFFAQIQGSVTVVFPNGEKLFLGYSDQNGHKYEPIGKLFFEKYPKEKVTSVLIESELRAMPEGQVKETLHKNPSFVFFSKREGAPKTSFGVDTVDGRTLAVDSRFFPKGALAFLEFEKPVFASEMDVEPTDWEKTSRFVMDNDIGGAIKGGGRADLFWGRGNASKRYASSIKHEAALYYLFPKPGFGVTVQ